MNRKIAAVLFAATMATTPAFAASVANPSDTPTARTETQAKVTKTSDVKKHHVHARASHGHKVHNATHAKPSQVKHSHMISKKSPTSASRKSDTKTTAVAPGQAPIKN